MLSKELPRLVSTESSRRSRGGAAALEGRTSRGRRARAYQRSSCPRTRSCIFWGSSAPPVGPRAATRATRPPPRARGRRPAGVDRARRDDDPFDRSLRRSPRGRRRRGCQVEESPRRRVATPPRLPRGYSAGDPPEETCKDDSHSARPPRPGRWDPPPRARSRPRPRPSRGPRPGALPIAPIGRRRTCAAAKRPWRRPWNRVRMFLL